MAKGYNKMSSKWIITVPRREYINDRIRISSDIIREGDSNINLWFEVPAVVEPYLLEDCVDSFLVAVIPIASIKGTDIIVEGKVSERLLFSIQYQILPVLVKYDSKFQDITISTNNKKLKIKENNLERHIGTGLSCGVDSFDSLISGINYEYYRIDTLTYFNVGSHRSTSGLNDVESRELFWGRYKRVLECAKDINMPIIAVDSNLGHFLNNMGVSYVAIHIFCSFSAVLACGSYFEHYHYASGISIESFNVNKISIGTVNIECFLTGCLSTEYLSFSISGLTKSRLEKIESICDSNIVQKHLNVCWNEEGNCGVCEKCIRTQLELYSIGKLDLFDHVFDLTKFYSKLTRHLIYVYKRARIPYYTEIIRELEKNDIVPGYIRIYGKLYNMIYKLFKTIHRRIRRKQKTQ